MNRESIGSDSETARSPQSKVDPIPQLLQPQLRQGIELFQQGNTLEALWNFFQSVGSEPQNPLGHYMCGLALKALSLEDEAQAEWMLVLNLTAAAVSPLALETDWLRGMAQRLLTSDATEIEHFPFRHFHGAYLSEVELPATDSRMLGQEGLERDIRSEVARRDHCYITDQFIADRLGTSTEEQISAWKQSFSEREGFECQPRQVTLSLGNAHDGAVFTKRGWSEDQKIQ